jgi:SSS family solute:Na+ symporter
MKPIDWLIVLLLNGGVMLWGLWVARGTKTSQDWFLGKRSLAGWAIGLSMFATNVDNADLVSLTGTTYREGIHIIMVHTFGALVGACFAAFYLVPAMARAGQFTNAEYLENRFGPATRVLSALIQLQYRSSMLGLMIWSVYLLLTSFLGLGDAAAWTLIVLIVGLAAVYTSMGGLKSVVLTDALQGAIMLLGTAVIFWAVWKAAGGWSQAVETLKSLPLNETQNASDLARMGRYFGDDGQTSPLVIAIGWMIIAGGYWSVNHSQTMRLAGARSIWDMKMAALFGAMISMPIMVACASLGVFGHALFPEFEAPDRLYPHMADLYLGAGLKGVVVAGIFAAAISTFDSIGSSLSALFTRDIYARLIAKDREDAHYVRVSRMATVGVLALGFAYVPFISSKDTMLKAFLTLIPVFVTPLFTIYIIGILTRAHRKAGIIGILTGAVYGLVSLYDREITDVDWLATWFTSRWAALIWAMVFSAAGALVATLVLGRQETEPSSAPTPGGWLESSSRALSAVPEHPFANAPPACLRPEYIAVLLIVGTGGTLLVFFW